MRLRRTTMASASGFSRGDERRHAAEIQLGRAIADLPFYAHLLLLAEGGEVRQPSVIGVKRRRCADCLGLALDDVGDPRPRLRAQAAELVGRRRERHAVEHLVAVAQPG